MQGQETIEAKIREYEDALDNAAQLYSEIQQLVTTQSNDYNLDVMTRLTTASINFKNTIEQADGTLLWSTQSIITINQKEIDGMGTILLQKHLGVLTNHLFS